MSYVQIEKPSSAATTARADPEARARLTKSRRRYFDEIGCFIEELKPLDTMNSIVQNRTGKKKTKK